MDKKPTDNPDLSAEIWSIAHIVHWLDMDRSTVEQRVICQPSFPASFRPTGKRTGSRRWFAADVREWAREAA